MKNNIETIKNYFNAIIGKEIPKWSVCRYEVESITSEITERKNDYDEIIYECSCIIKSTYDDEITGRHEERTYDGKIWSYEPDYLDYIYISWYEGSRYESGRIDPYKK